MEQYGDGHPYTQLPPIDGFAWLASAWQEAGLCAHGMAGPVPLPWSEIDAYGRITGAYSAWALGMLRAMSEAYCRWYSKGCQQKDIADDVPYIEQTDDTLEAAGQAIIRSREASAKLREDI